MEKQETNNQDYSLITEVKLENDMRARILAYKGKKYLDIRKYYNDFPTKKGIRFNLACLAQITDLLKDNDIDNII